MRAVDKEELLMAVIGSASNETPLQLIEIHSTPQM